MKESLISRLGIKDPALKDILESMLQFNPYFRPSAKELLKHSYFDDIRSAEFEKYHASRQLFEYDMDHCFSTTDNDFNVSLEELNRSLAEKVQSFKVKAKPTKKNSF